jgi:cytochrome P450
LELCKNKDIQEKLYQSVKTISLEKETNSLPLIDCSAAPYLDNFLREVQRLHSIVPRVPRKCNENIEIDGKIISAGSIVHVYLKGIHLNPK